MNIGFIGFGNMANAIAFGLLKKKAHSLFAAAPSLSIGINENGIHTHNDNLAILPHADVLILAVKPYQMPSVIQQIKDKMSKDCLVISIAAGIGPSWFLTHKLQHPIVCAMPNLAATLGLSATPLIANNDATVLQKKQAEEIFDSIGTLCWAQSEDEMNAFTALSGSGPAYVLQFMDGMTNAAISLGLDKDIAQSFTLQTFKGALSLASKTPVSLNELTQKITSPGGTTEAALNVFQEEKLEQLILHAMNAACERAKNLGSK